MPRALGTGLFTKRTPKETYGLFEQRYLPFAEEVAKELGLPKVNKLIIKRKAQGVFLDGNGLKLDIDCPDADDNLPIEYWKSYYSDIALLLKEFQIKGKGFLPADVYCERGIGPLEYIEMRIYSATRGRSGK